MVTSSIECCEGVSILRESIASGQSGAEPGEKGLVSADRISCVPCQIGWYRDDHTCKKCPAGMTSQLGSTSEEQCHAAPLLLVQGIALVLLSMPLAFELHRTIIGRIPISDIHTESGCLVVVTSVPHRVLQRPWWPAPRASIRHTSHFLLDGKSFHIQFKSKCSLQLLDENGAPIRTLGRGMLQIAGEQAHVAASLV